MKKILVIDDDDHLRSDLLDILSFEGYETLGARDGYEGVRAAQEHRPDLIICDITMPGMNGFEVIELLRRESLTSNIPVFFLSARGEDVFVQKGMQMGAAAYFAKPYNLGTLLAAVQAQIGK